MSLEQALRTALTEARREANRREVGEAVGEDPYDRVVRLCQNTIQEAEALKQHQHDWNEAGVCTICGADGNA